MCNDPAAYNKRLAGRPGNEANVSLHTQMWVSIIQFTLQMWDHMTNLHYKREEQMAPHNNYVSSVLYISHKRMR